MKLIIVAIISFFLTGCFVRPSYYLSPYNPNTAYYHIVPLHGDSIKTATFATGVLVFGGSNYGLRDRILAAQGNLYQARNFGRFGAWYGGDLSLGSYHVAEYNDYDRYDTRQGNSTYHIPESNQSFGSFGANGGFYYVFPHDRFPGTEIKIGTEAAFQHEFGNYLAYRRSLPDTLIEKLETASRMNNLGGYIDFMWTNGNKRSIGYKLGAGKTARYPGNRYSLYDPHPSPVYVLQTLYFTRHNTTWFGQLTFSMNASSLQAGMTWKLGKR